MIFALLYAAIASPEKFNDVFLVVAALLVGLTIMWIRGDLMLDEMENQLVVFTLVIGAIALGIASVIHVTYVPACAHLIWAQFSFSKN